MINIRSAMGRGARTGCDGHPSWGRRLRGGLTVVDMTAQLLVVRERASASAPRLRSTVPTNRGGKRA